MKKVIKIKENDNVAVALTDIKNDEVIIVDSDEIIVKEDIKRGHKIALSEIPEGENIIKYGFPIGHAIKNIAAGTQVHVHNIKTNLQGINSYVFDQKLTENNYEDRRLTFKGYRREDGNIGIRNELWIIPTVGCINGIADKIADRFKKEVKDIKIDDVNVLKHSYGCSQLGCDHINTRTILKDAVKHPNAGGVLVIGLGCENNRLDEFIDCLGNYNKKRIRFMQAQEVSDEISEGTRILHQLYEYMAENDRREDIPLSELKIGLKCGGSDGLSGITANPLLGRFSDFLISQGGTTVLTEVPEMFGAETLLMDRAENKEIYDKEVDMINDFKNYFIKYDQPIYENPSPGNKEGGISTLEDKSLGCVQKAGTETVSDVLKYGEILTQKGLNLLSAPGNDLVASSALAATGCQMVLFTTGRGTPFGSFVPTVKVSTNSQIYKFKPGWIDFNAGELIEDVSMEKLLEMFIKFVIEVADGKLVNNEKNNFKEIAIFKTGITL